MFRPALLILLSASQLFPALIITEVMPCPIGGDNNREYIELYNPGSSTEDAGLYSLARPGSSPGRLLPARGTTFIPPGCYALITTPAGYTHFAPRIPADTIPLTEDRSRLTGYGLTDNGMQINLHDPAGAIASTCRWSGNPGENCALERGAPLENAIWHRNPWGGTPGRANRFWLCPKPVSRLHLTRALCSPDTGQPLQIRIRTTDDESADLSIYTLTGKRIRRMQLPGNPAGMTAVWYGRDDSGVERPSGCYLLICSIRKHGSLVYHSKHAIALVRR